MRARLKKSITLRVNPDNKDFIYFAAGLEGDVIALSSHEFANEVYTSYQVVFCHYQILYPLIVSSKFVDIIDKGANTKSIKINKKRV